MQTALFLSLLLPGLAPDVSDAPAIRWTKTVLDRKFRTEGVAIADVNKDGEIDVFNGEYWYQAPDWTPHEMRPPMDFKDGLSNYSRCFACWPGDFNKDGFPDLIVIDFPGAPCYWLENPAGQPGHWKQHIIWHSACNETPQYADLFGTGQPVLIMGTQPKGKETEGQMAYFTPTEDPKALWTMHPISEPSTPGKEIPGTRKFSHGLGSGDVNGDGRTDVICTAGWWEQPATKSDSAWKFHAANFGDAVADMFAVDVDADGKNDIISTSAHKFGIWFHKQRVNPKTTVINWEQNTLFGMLVSETHAANWVDIDGDGRKDLVTGKRWWSHGRSEPGSGWNAEIYYLRNMKQPDGIIRFAPTLIDSDSGIGTQFVVDDLNGDGLPDIISSNKKGVRVIVQQRK
ncbi:MAG: FG-GAP repeat domain-containing protein [Gemmataceae bacterium]